MKARPFYEVLEEQIRADLRKEIEAEVRARLNEELPKDPQSSAKTSAFERLETWLASHLTRPTFSHQTTRAYRTYASRSHQQTPPKSEPSSQQHETVYEARSVEEICAIELLRRHGARLENRFTATELKTAWRRAALKTHPDRFTTSDAVTQTRMAAIFRELCAAYELLQETQETRLAA